MRLVITKPHGELATGVADPLRMKHRSLSKRSPDERSDIRESFFPRTLSANPHVAGAHAGYGLLKRPTCRFCFLLGAARSDASRTMATSANLPMPCVSMQRVDACGHPSRRRFAPPQDEVCGCLDAEERAPRPSKHAERRMQRKRASSIYAVLAAALPSAACAAARR